MLIMCHPHNTHCAGKKTYAALSTVHSEHVSTITHKSRQYVVHKCYWQSRKLSSTVTFVWGKGHPGQGPLWNFWFYTEFFFFFNEKNVTVSHCLGCVGLQTAHTENRDFITARGGCPVTQPPPPLRLHHALNIQDPLDRLNVFCIF